MFLLTNFIKAGAKYSMEMVNSIVNECGERIFNCYCLVHDSHPHKKHTMDFLQAITASSYYEQSQPMRFVHVAKIDQFIPIQLYNNPILHFLFQGKVEGYNVECV